MKRILEYQDTPIPDLSQMAKDKAGYRQWPIDVGTPEYGEPCVEIGAYGIAGLNHYYRDINPPYDGRVPGSIPELFVRIGVARKLQEINEELAGHDLELFVHDGWRPPAVQSYFHDTWFPERLRQTYPDWPEQRIRDEVGDYWAQGPATFEAIDPASPPPHSTGGATDVTIRHRESRELLWMGTIFDDVSKRAHADSLERQERTLSFSDDEARKNRRLLYWILVEHGFIVNPTEWWHASYGDQMWAKVRSGQAGIEMPALYSAIDPFA
jgi:D-alanyl-D-alanine dipeptidase